MTIPKALLLVAGCIVTGGVLGGLTGWLGGTWFPGYYRAIFGTRSERSDFQPVEVAVGMGIPQGMMLGAVVGVVLAALFVWLEARRLAALRGDRPGTPFLAEAEDPGGLSHPTGSRSTGVRRPG